MGLHTEQPEQKKAHHDVRTIHKHATALPLLLNGGSMREDSALSRVASVVYKFSVLLSSRLTSVLRSSHRDRTVVIEYN
jgi:hypothetical protein